MLDPRDMHIHVSNVNTGHDVEAKPYRQGEDSEQAYRQTEKSEIIFHLSFDLGNTNTASRYTDTHILNNFNI